MNQKIINSLENLLKIEKQYYNLDIEYIEEVKKLAIIIISNPTFDFKDMKLGDRSPQIALNEVFEFIGNVSKDLQNRFYNFMNEYKSEKNKAPNVKFNKIFSPEQYYETGVFYGEEDSGVLEEGDVILDYYGTVTDTYNAGHELIHKCCNLLSDEDATIYTWLSECSPVYSELLLKDFLVAKDMYTYEEINEKIKNRFGNCYTAAIGIIVEGELFDYYRKSKKFDQKDYFKFVNMIHAKYNISIEDINSSINTVVYKKDFQYYEWSWYVIAIMFACYFHQVYKKNQKMQYYVLEEMIDTCSLDDSYFNECIQRLKALNVPFISNDGISVNENIRSVLSIAYVKELHALMKEQELENNQVKR